MKTAIFASFALAAAMTVSAASAATVSATESITSRGQVLSFSTAAAPAGSGGATLNVVLNGDFSPNYPQGENAVLRLDSLGGSMKLAFSGGTHVVNNSISGVSLLSSSATETYAYLDSVLNYSFAVSETALSTILADNMFTGSFDLGNGVNPFNRHDRDFVSVSLSYNDYSPLSTVVAPQVPLPAALPLLGGALAGLGLLRRRAKS